MQKHFVLNEESSGQRGGGDSGVAGRQVEATKYVEFRNVAASFFTRDVGNFHGKHSVSQGFVRYVVPLSTV
jgi:hypothetical protein